MIRSKKILVTGPAGKIGYALSSMLARDNDVWGISRFRDDTARARVEAAGITTRAVDLAAGEFGDLPADFDYVIHAAAFLEATDDSEMAIKVNAEGTGLLMRHCRAARGVLIMSTNAVYKPHSDPWHPYSETDPLGVSELPGFPNYAVSKLGEEFVARTCARLFRVPTIITRINMTYSDAWGPPVDHLDAIAAGKSVRMRCDPLPYSPIHVQDMLGMLPRMLAAATIPATIVNWCGDEVVTVRDWCAFLGQLVGIEPRLDIMSTG